MHRRPSLLGVAVAALVAWGGLATPGAEPQDGSAPRTGVAQEVGTSPEQRLIAIGDIHGAYPQLVELLGRTGLLDEQGRWAGGETTLVMTGDYVDRGARIRPVLDLLMTLERQAEAGGGRVIVLLGNHETMNLMKLQQDVSSEAVASFADDRSEERRVEAYDRYERFVRSRRRDLGRDPPGLLGEEAWMEAHPPGLIEYVEAFGPKGTYGRWLREKDAVVKVDDTVFLHGGLNPEYAESTLDGVNELVHDEIDRFDDSWQRLVDRGVILPFFTFYDIVEAARADLETWIERLQTASPLISPTFNVDRPYLDMLVELLNISSWSIVHEDGPLWFRGFAFWSPEEGAPQVDELQKRYQAKRFVVGHTVHEMHEVVQRFDDRVFLIDTGMLSDVYLGGQATALEIVGDRITAIYPDRRVPLVEPVLASR